VSFYKSPSDIKDSVNRANIAVETLASELAPYIGKTLENFDMPGWQSFVIAWRDWYKDTTESLFAMMAGNTYDTAEQYHAQAKLWRDKAYGVGLLTHKGDPTDLPEQKDPLAADYIKPLVLLGVAYLAVKLIRG
jgi:hypothetical protein